MTDAMRGQVFRVDLGQTFDYELTATLGALSPATMRQSPLHFGWRFRERRQLNDRASLAVRGAAASLA